MEKVLVSGSAGCIGGRGLAAGIVTAVEHPDASSEDFNLSTAPGTTLLQLAELIRRKISRAVEAGTI
jgi:nucleoside-diphosphate-sugar epimerase